LPPNTSIEVHVTGKAPVKHERDHVLSALTACKGGAVSSASRYLRRQASRCRSARSRHAEERVVPASTRTSTLEIEVLTDAVVSTIQVDGRRHSIPRADPEYVLVAVGEILVVVDETEIVAPRRESARHKWVVRILEGEVLISAVQFPGSDRVSRTHRKHGVVGDRARDTSERARNGVADSRNGCATAGRWRTKLVCGKL